MNSQELTPAQLSKMPWYPRDFASSTRGWPIVVRGVYRELLDSQWDQGGLPENPEILRAIALVTPVEWRTAWAVLESKFPICEDGLRRNRRLESHREKVIKEVERRRKGAHTTNREYWNRNSA